MFDAFVWLIRRIFGDPDEPIPEEPIIVHRKR